jgi:hypothetical protein
MNKYPETRIRPRYNMPIRYCTAAIKTAFRSPQPGRGYKAVLAFEHVLISAVRTASRIPRSAGCWGYAMRPWSPTPAKTRPGRAPLPPHAGLVLYLCKLDLKNNSKSLYLVFQVLYTGMRYVPGAVLGIFYVPGDHRSAFLCAWRSQGLFYVPGGPRSFLCAWRS